MLNQLISFSLIVLTIYISLFDFKFHRILNKSLLLLIFILSFSINPPPLKYLFLVVTVLWLFGIPARLGMGDLKMMTILIALQGQIILTSHWSILFALIAGISVLAHIARNKSFSGEIALAPAILIPFTAIYLGIYPGF